MKTIYFEKDIPRILITKFAAKCCKPLLFTGLSPVKYKKNIPDPPLPAHDWLRVKNIACGLCSTIGLGIVQALKIVQPDCEVWIMTRSKHKQDFARKLGADHILTGDPYEATSKATGGSPVYTGMNKNKMFFGGFDRIYDCLGGNWANNLCVRLLGPRGTLLKVGHHMNAVRFDETPIWWHELKLIDVDAHGMEEWHGLFEGCSLIAH